MGKPQQGAQGAILAEAPGARKFRRRRPPPPPQLVEQLAHPARRAATPNVPFHQT
jgi:hypothetical protein